VIRAPARARWTLTVCVLLLGLSTTARAAPKAGPGFRFENVVGDYALKEQQHEGSDLPSCVQG